jgi:HTH-type transcriptional regulator/antitoxin HigA
MTVMVSEKYTYKEIGIPRTIKSERQYDEYAETLFAIENKPRMTQLEESYAKVLWALIKEYDEKNNPIPDASPAEVLQTLLEANNLRQKDLAPLLGSESIVSEILSGERPFSKNHIKKLSARFHVSPAVFFEEPAPKPAVRVHEGSFED